MTWVQATTFLLRMSQSTALPLLHHPGTRFTDSLSNFWNKKKVRSKDKFVSQRPSHPANWRRKCTWSQCLTSGSMFEKACTDRAVVERSPQSWILTQRSAEFRPNSCQLSAEPLVQSSWNMLQDEVLVGLLSHGRHGTFCWWLLVSPAILYQWISMAFMNLYISLYII